MNCELALTPTSIFVEQQYYLLLLFVMRLKPYATKTSAAKQQPDYLLLLFVLLSVCVREFLSLRVSAATLTLSAHARIC